MAAFIFDYVNLENKNCRVHVHATFEHDAWIMALKKCGWDNRIYLKLVNNKGNTITNWFEKSPDLGFNEANRQHFIRTRELRNNNKHHLWGLSYLKSSLFCSC